MTHIVTSPLVIAKDAAGADVYVYFGHSVPSNIPEAEIARLAEGGFLTELDTDEPVYPEGDPADSWTVKQLRAYAQEFDVDLGTATAKADILSALV